MTAKQYRREEAEIQRRIMSLCEKVKLYQKELPGACGRYATNLMLGIQRARSDILIEKQQLIGFRKWRQARFV